KPSASRSAASPYRCTSPVSQRNNILMFSRPHPFRSPRLDSQKGGALLAVLWLSAALAAIGFAVSTRVLAETDHVSATADGLRAQYLASGSVERAIQWMGWGPGRPNADGAGQFWRR